jgi:excisionase family DNA binding protein
VSTQHTTWTTTGLPPALRIPATVASASQIAAAPAQLRLLSVREIATTCQLSEKAVRRAIDDGELTAVKLRSRLRVTPQDFEAWITAQRQPRPRRSLTSPTQRLSRRAPTGTFRALAHADADLGGMQ